jgi:internalin A
MTDQELLQTIEQAAREGWEELDLSDQQLTALPPEIGQLTQLKVLKLGSKVLKLGSKEWWKEDNPTKNQLATLPSELFALANLTELDLSGNQLTALPPEIGKLTNLTTLTLGSNQLTALPPEIFTLSSLTTLDLSGNQSIALSPEIGKLTNLTTLKLLGNQLTALPPELFTLTNLTELDLRGNQLTVLPPEIGKLTNLTTLALSGDQLTVLPPEIGKLTNLTTLALSRNQLTALPPEIGKLTNLTRLWLYSNQLAALPIQLFTLSNLTSLALHNNHLTALPSELGALTNLTGLWLQNNHLTALPLELEQLTKLEKLYIDDNPLKSPPPEIVEQGTQAILEYLREQAQGCSQQWLSKLVLVGEGGVGKTSLLRALRGEPFVEGLDTTRGITIETLDLPHPKEPEVVMHLNAWDFGGQEIYHATHQFFLTNRSLFLLLWNARHGYEQGKLYYWLDQLQARAPQSPVLLVATHIDEREPDLPLAELQAKYPQIVGNWGVSNKTGDGLAALRTALTDAAAKLPLMGGKWPTNWLNAAEAIRARCEKHITPPQLAEIMTAHQVAKSSQAVLTRWLHELGEILYFQGDEELSDLVILKPQWVTDYIYKVLDCEDVICKEGIFTREQKQALWGDLDPEMHEHFLRLMEKFDLSYRTLENREVSLVVERLPLDPPDYTVLWEGIREQLPCREIAMRFKLNTLPAGIPTWFIARSHRFTTHTHWRTGAVFGDQPNEPRHLALVQAFSHHHYLQLTVRGPNPHNFFALLKDGLDLTLARFPGLQIERKMPCPGHDGQPCDYEFDYANLQTALEKNRFNVPCSKTWEDVSVLNLLFGLDWRTQDAVLERIDTLEAKVVEKVVEVKDDLLGELHNLRELTQREFLNLFKREQAQLESACPNVFVLTEYTFRSKRHPVAGSERHLPPSIHCNMIEFLKKLPNIQDPYGQQALISSAAFDAALQDQIKTGLPPSQFCPLLVETLSRFGTMQDRRDPLIVLLEITQTMIGQEGQAYSAELIKQLRRLSKRKTHPATILCLKLYCQAPGHWHPVVEGGLYELDQSKKWLKAIAPYLRKMIGVLKYAKPLTGNGEAANTFHADLEMTQTAIAKVPATRDEWMVGQEHDDMQAERVTGAALRALRELLDKKDPQHYWGGLRKVLTPEGHYLWLCAEHAQEYAI